MKWLFLFLLTPLLLQAADEDGTWSKPVNGLMARLSISPLKKGDDGRPHFGLFLQLKRKDDMAGLMQVSYSPRTLALQVIDQDGKEWPREGLVAGNQFVFPWIPLVLPYDAFLSFNVGGSMRQGAGERLGEYLEFNFWNQWRIPPPNSTTYYLTGIFTIPSAPRNNPNGSNNWSGTVVLPKVEIPRIP